MISILLGTVTSITGIGTGTGTLRLGRKVEESN